MFAPYHKFIEFENAYFPKQRQHRLRLIRIFIEFASVLFIKPIGYIGIIVPRLLFVKTYS